MTITRDASIEGMVWLTAGDGTRLGYERLSPLEEIPAAGSVSQAACDLRLAYKAARDTVNAFNDLAAEPLVMRRAGEHHGGGTLENSAGLQLIEMFRQEVGSS
jgi:molybdate transport repressor ModE-like protein